MIDDDGYYLYLYWTLYFSLICFDAFSCRVVLSCVDIFRLPPRKGLDSINLD